MSQPLAPEPTARATITDADLVTIQNTAGMHLTFSMTLACPLRCAHCIVKAGPKVKGTTLPLEMAARYASQMEDLFDYGIRMVSFTGGEPLLMRRQLKVLSDAAASAGMACGVVTASHWAHSDAAARDVVARYPGIHTWDLSLDAWHKDYLPYDYVRRAYGAAKAAGRRAVLRFTYNEPMSAADREAFDFIHSFADAADVYSQRLRSVGRGDFVPIGRSSDQTTLAKPCVTKGLVAWRPAASTWWRSAHTPFSLATRQCAHCAPCWKTT
ncbi:MAG: radical SAM protein [Rhodoferax sp.]|nr:radical SAM protein [Rhodoferax sp.]